MSSAATQAPNKTTDYFFIGEPDFSQFQLTVFQVSLTLLAVVGVLGNLIIISVVLTFKRWRVPTNIILCNVAIADLIICLWTIPVHVVCIGTTWWPLPIWICSLGGFLDNASYACSAWSLAFGSIERFYMVVSRARSRHKLSASLSILICGIIWMSSVIIAILPVLGWNRYVYSHITWSCGFDGNGTGIHKYYFVVFLILVLVVPLVIIVFNYSYVFISIAGMPNRYITERRNHLKVAIPLLIITVAFLMTFLPPVVIITIVLFAPEKILLNSMHYNIIHWVLLAGSCINPLICAFLSKKFRGATKQLLLCLGQCVFGAVNKILSCDAECLTQIRYCLSFYVDDFTRRFRKKMKSARKTIISRICPRIFRSDSDNFVIKVTITNHQSDSEEISLNPLLSAMAPQGQTQITSAGNSKQSESLKRQNSPDSNQAVFECCQAQSVRIRQTSAERNLPGILNEVIEEEVEPIVAMCTCRMRRCICEIPATPV